MSSIKKLFKRLNVRNDEVVLVRSHDSVGAEKNKQYFDELLLHLKDSGTLCLLDDCDFNTKVQEGDIVATVSNQERFVLSSNKMLQLLTLRRDCHYADHPALMFASVGKYAKYFARPKPLDFPYGESSIFEDLYEMDAVVIFVSAKQIPYEGKYAYSKNDGRVISKNTSVSDDDLVSYLDFEVDYDWLHAQIFGSGLMLFEIDGDEVIYGVRYRDYIRLIKERLNFR